MKLNGVETGISAYTSETLNDEMVLYNEDSKKIIVLNQTAMLVWKEITESHLKNENICTKVISSTIVKIYELPESEMGKAINKKFIYSKSNNTFLCKWLSSLLE